MTLDQFIAQLQTLRAQHGGDLQVWILEPSPVGPRAFVGELLDSDVRLPPDKVVYVE
jgi:hypothetical protein